MALSTCMVCKIFALRIVYSTRTYGEREIGAAHKEDVFANKTRIPTLPFTCKTLIYDVKLLQNDKNFIYI